MGRRDRLCDHALAGRAACAHAIATLGPARVRRGSVALRHEIGDGCRDVHERFLATGGQPGVQRLDRLHQRPARQSGVLDRRARGWPYPRRRVCQPIPWLGLLGRDGFDPWCGIHESTRSRALARARSRLARINSFSTAEGGVAAPLVDVGAGERGGLRRARTSRARSCSVMRRSDSCGSRRSRRAAPSASSRRRIAPYIVPPIRARSRARAIGHPAVGQRALRRDAKAFGFKASWRAASRLRERLHEGPVHVRVDVKSTFYDGPEPDRSSPRSPDAPSPTSASSWRRTSRSRARTTMRAGAGRCSALARALARGHRGGALPAPGRTLTFIWVDEIRGSRQWLADRIRPRPRASSTCSRWT